MKTIVLDCDDVLANARIPFAEVISNKTNRFVHFSEWNRWEACVENHNITFDDIIPQILLTKVLEKLEPEVGAAIVTNMFKLLGYRIVVVSARGFHPNAYNVTHNWLNKHNITFDELIITPQNGNKAEVISKLGEVELFVDDNIRNVLSVSGLDNVNQSVVMNMPWNKLDLYDYRVDKLSDVIKLL